MTENPDARAPQSMLGGLRPGTHLMGYRLLRRLGAGGMGAVWEAENEAGEHVAMKILHPQIAADPMARRRLDREASVLERVHDARVARILDIETGESEASQGVTFVITELVDGPTLQHEIDHEGVYNLSTDARDLADLAHGLVDALRAVHKAGVIHRDLKPSNVMLGEQGPILIDFGIAQVADDVRLTQTGQVTGTPGFIPPEMLDGGEPNPGVDWYACAGVLLFTVTGRAPFGSGPWPTVFRRVYAGNLELGDLEETCPALAQAFSAALAPQPEDRISPEDLLAVLDEIADGGSGHIALAEALGLEDEDADYGYAPNSAFSPDSEVTEEYGTVGRSYGVVPGSSSAGSAGSAASASGSYGSVPTHGRSPASSREGYGYVSGAYGLSEHSAASSAPSAGSASAASAPSTSSAPSVHQAPPAAQQRVAPGAYGLSAPSAPTSGPSSAPSRPAQPGRPGHSQPQAAPRPPAHPRPQYAPGSAGTPAAFSGTSANSGNIAYTASRTPYASVFTSAASPGANTGGHAIQPRALSQPAPAAPAGALPSQQGALPDWALEPQRHPLFVAAATTIVLALGNFAPFWMMLIVSVVVAVMGTVGRAQDSLRWNRLQNGSISPGDTTRMWAASPWYFLRSLVATFFAMCVGLIVVYVTMSVGVKIFGVSSPPLILSSWPDQSRALLLILCIEVAFLVTLWFIPWGAQARRGAAQLVPLVARGPFERRIWMLGMVAVALAIAVLRLTMFRQILTLAPFTSL